MEKKILLDCRDATLGYEGRPVWEHLRFQVHSGDYVCIVVKTAAASPRW